MMNSMQLWFAGLERREQVIVGAGALIVAGALLWVLLLKPLNDGVGRLSERVESKTGVLAQLYGAQDELMVAARGGTGAPQAGLSLIVIVDRTTKTSGLANYLSRNNPDGDNAIQVRFEDAPFDLVVGWLGDIGRQHGLTVALASFDAARGAGLVNASLTLERQSG